MAYTDFLAEMIAGTSLPLRFTITTDGVAQNVSTWTDWRLTGKTSLSQTDAQALFAKTTASGVTITDGANGIVDTLLLPADTLAIVKTTRVYVELQADAGSATHVPATGYLLIHPSVTKNA